MSLKFRITLSVGFGRQINLENNEKKRRKELQNLQEA